MKGIMWSFDDTQPRFRHEKWREVFDSQLSSTPFSIQSADPMFSLPLGENSEKFTYWLTPEAVWDRFRSLSQISVLTGRDLAVHHSWFFWASFSDIESGHQEQSLWGLDGSRRSEERGRRNRTTWSNCVGVFKCNSGRPFERRRVSNIRLCEGTK